MGRHKIVLPSLDGLPSIADTAPPVVRIVNCCLCNAETVASFEARGRPYCEKCYYRRPLYSHGLPFSEKLAENIDDLKDRISKGKASLILIDGGIGEGKTTLAVEIAEYYQGGPIVFDEQLAMGGSEFAKKLKGCHKAGRPVLIYDEAGDFNSRAALTRLNALLNRVFETFRAFKILIILCLPSFQVLDASLMQKQIPRLLLHCYERTEVKGNFAGYSLRRMFFIKDKMKKEIVQPSAYIYVHPNFYGHNLNLSIGRSAELDKYSTTGKMEILELAEIYTEGFVSYGQLALKLNRTIRWVQMQIKALSLSPAKVYKGKNFYSPETVDILAQHLRGS